MLIWTSVCSTKFKNTDFNGLDTSINISPVVSDESLVTWSVWSFLLNATSIYHTNLTIPAVVLFSIWLHYIHCKCNIRPIIHISNATVQWGRTLIMLMHIDCFDSHKIKFFFSVNKFNMIPWLKGVWYVKTLGFCFFFVFCSFMSPFAQKGNDLNLSVLAQTSINASSATGRESTLRLWLTYRLMRKRRLNLKVKWLMSYIC